MSDLFPKEDIERILKNYVKYEENPELVLTTFARIKKFEVRDSDVFLIGFPKSGTTWAQEMVWLILNDLDYEGAKVYIDERFPNFELSGSDYTTSNPDMEAPECHTDSLTFANDMKSPRSIKTHLLFEELPEQLLNGTKTAKIIYVARNPKDVCLSLFYHYKNLYKLYTGSLEDYCKLFMCDLTGMREYWKNNLYFWNRRNENHILFVKYEEMKSNLSEVIQRVSKFLGKSLTKEQEVQLLKWLDFESMKNNSAVNHVNLYHQTGFMRKGKVGEHKKEMSPEIISKFDAWIKESLKGSNYEM